MIRCYSSLWVKEHRLQLLGPCFPLRSGKGWARSLTPCPAHEFWDPWSEIDQVDKNTRILWSKAVDPTWWGSERSFRVANHTYNLSVLGSFSVDRKSSMAARGLEGQAGRCGAHIVLRVLPRWVGRPREMQEHVSVAFQFLSSLSLRWGPELEGQDTDQDLQFRRTWPACRAASLVLFPFQSSSWLGAWASLPASEGSPQNGAVPFSLGQGPFSFFSRYSEFSWPSSMASVRRLETLFLTFGIVLELSGPSGMYISWIFHLEFRKLTAPGRDIFQGYLWFHVGGVYHIWPVLLTSPLVVGQSFLQGDKTQAQGWKA